MRSAPLATAVSKTFRDPSTLIARLASLAWITVKARCTTTSAPFTASRTLSGSCTSPWRYSVFRHPRLAGSNGRRAIPTIRFTRRERSSADTRAIPRSPVGPVTATVSPSWGTRVLYRVRRPWGGPSVDRDLRAALQHVHLVGHDRVRARPAPHHVALAVVHVDRVVAGAGRDHVAAAPADHAVVAAPQRHAVFPGARVDHERAVPPLDLVIALPAREVGGTTLGEDLVVAGAPARVVPAARTRSAGVDPIVAGAAVEPIGSWLPEQHVVARLAEHLVVVRAGVGHVVAVAQLDPVVAAAADRQVVARPRIDPVVAGPTLQVVVSAQPVQVVVAVLAPQAVRAGRSRQRVREIGRAHV